MCSGDLSGNCKRWSTADIVKQQAQAQHVIKMKESSVTKHLLDGHFFSIWSQSWLRNWPMRFMLGMLSLYHQQAEKKCMLWLKIVWINWSRASRESVGNKCIDGAHRLCVRWDCHKISITWGPSVKYLFFPELWQKVERGRVLEL